MRSVGEIPAIRSAPKTARPPSEEEIRKHLRSLPYEKYLLTSWWRVRRNRALKDGGYKCVACGCRRDLQVHHLSYDRLGDEQPEDLEIRCRGCHLGEHAAEVQSYVRHYARVLSDVLDGGPADDLTGVVEETKARIAKLGIPYRPNEFNAAVSRVLPRVPFTPPKGKAELFETGQGNQPLTHAEAARILAELGAAGLMRHVPQVKPRTVRQAERHRALQLVAQAIADQVRRCEEAEAAVKP